MLHQRFVESTQAGGRLFARFSDQRFRQLTLLMLMAVSAGILFVVFFLCAGILLRGAAVARRRATLIMQGPLAALWETIGHAGAPPRDSSEGFAMISVGLTALVWIVGPAVLAAFLLL